MSKLLEVFDIVPSWLYAAAIAALLLFGGVQSVRLADSHAETANIEATRQKEIAQRAKEDEQRATLYAADQRQMAHLQQAHAAAQQEKTDAYTKRIANLEAARASAARTIAGLQHAAESYAAGDRHEGETDAAACQRDRDRLRVLGGLLSEGIGLVDEGRRLVEVRDAQVDYLKRIDENDRALSERAAK